MIKRRGYRVELGEIEAALYRHDSITEAAVMALQDQADGICITAFITWSESKHPSIIALKRFCMENLPAYMIPDRFSVQPSLPKTSTDKVDYRRLREMA
jgi:acyl-coenzyme A synthetase/AMP-(fatty) acid ligase